MSTSTVSASPAETRAYMLSTLTGRGYTVLRHILRQMPADASSRVSVLGPMVTDRKRRSLQLYLLLVTIWPWLENQTDPLSSAVWARALSTDRGRKWTPSNVSSAWTDLEARGLIERRRRSRSVQVAPRREDGKAKYTQPSGISGDRYETYFVLPPEFWTEEWFERLSLPGLAMLLIIAGETSDKAEVWLTNDDAARWYGLSPRSVEAGIEDLKKNQLLEERVEWIKAPLSPIGSTKRHWYALEGPFSWASREDLKAKAQAELRKRTAGSAQLVEADGQASKKKARKKKGSPKSSQKSSQKTSEKMSTRSAAGESA